jgi:4-hydroxy-2-oxoheptanedioate aldolase
MRGNRVKEKLAAGQVATAIAGHSLSGDTIDFLGLSGFDGVWLEGEHGPVNWDAIGDLSRACDLWGMASLMRIQDKEPGRITRTLDRGVNGIIIPHVNTRQDAERVVQATRFAPIGRRGIFGGRRSYGSPDFFQQANDEILVIVLIEEIEAVENLADILSVEHIDVFYVAPGDLAQTMGLLGQLNHPQVRSTVDQALRQIVAAGRVAGTLAHEENLERFVKLGVRFFSTSFDQWLLEGGRRYLGRLNQLTMNN